MISEPSDTWTILAWVTWRSVGICLVVSSEIQGVSFSKEGLDPRVKDVMLSRCLWLLWCSQVLRGVVRKERE